METNKNKKYSCCECCDDCYDGRSNIRITRDYIYDILDKSEIIVTTVFDKCTIVSCKLPSGFVIVESSACVDPNNYDEDYGAEICIDKIVDKLYELEGYLLQEALSLNSYGEDEDNLSSDYERVNYDYEAKYHDFDPMDDFDDFYEIYAGYIRK